VNPLFKAAADTADGGFVMGLVTAGFLICFFGWVAYAWWPGSGDEMARRARMPLEED